MVHAKMGNIISLIAIMAFAIGLLCGLGGLAPAGVGCALAAEAASQANTASQAESSGPTEAPPAPISEDITTLEQFTDWYQRQLQGGNTIGVLPQGLVIDRKIELKSLPNTEGELKPLPNTKEAQQSAPARQSASAQTQQQIQLQIPNQNKPIRIMGQGSLTVDNPNLLISGVYHLFSVEKFGELILNNGTITVQDKSQPAIVSAWGRQVTINRACIGFGNLRVDSGDRQEPNFSDESQTPDGGETQTAKPELTEALLLNISSDGNGTARLTFENIPSDITGLYIYRSENGTSWKKEKNKPVSSLTQETVEYENFLKEPGNILNNTGIIENGSILYHFQTGNNSFYVKAEIERPSQTWETQKLKVAIPSSAGSGLTYSWGGYDSYGGSYGYGSYGISDGGSSGYSAKSKEQDNTADETDAPEGPVIRGGRRRSAYNPELYQLIESSDPSKTAGRPLATPSTATPSITTPSTATPSTASGSNVDGNPAGQSRKDGTTSDQPGAPDIENENPPDFSEGAPEPDQSENQDSPGKEIRTKMAYAAGIFISVLLCGGGMYYVHSTRKESKL